MLSTRDRLLEERAMPDRDATTDGTPGGGTPSRAVGLGLLRKEDARLLTGQGRFVGDIDLPRMLHLTVVRAERIGRIRSVDRDDARSMPGVVGCFSAADLAGAFQSPLPLAWPVTPEIRVPEHRPLAGDVARHVGEAVAVVVATDAAMAADAADAARIEIERMPAVTDVEAALR